MSNEEQLYTIANGEIVPSKEWYLLYAQNISRTRAALGSYQWLLQNLNASSTSDDLLYFARVDEALYKLEKWLEGRDLSRNYYLSKGEVADLRSATQYFAAMCTRTPPGNLDTSFYGILYRIQNRNPELMDDPQSEYFVMMRKLERQAQTLRIDADNALSLVGQLMEAHSKLR